MKIKTKVLNSAVCIACGLSTSGAVGAQALNVFNYIGSGDLAVNPSFEAKGSCYMPTGSWYSILSGDNACGGTGGTTVADYRSFRSSDPAGSDGQLDMNVINTITPGSGAINNTGNMIDRDSYVKAGADYLSNPTTSTREGWAAHFTTTPLTVSGVDSTRATVDMSGWRLTWSSEIIDLGSGYAEALSNDGIWGNGNDTLDYFVPNSFTGIATNNAGLLVNGYGDSTVGGYRLHLEGSFTPSMVPIPSAAWLMGSGLLGLFGVSRRRRGRRDG